MELNENYDAETWLAEWWPIVLANFKKIQLAVNDNAQAIDTERTMREQSDKRYTECLEIFGEIITSSGDEDGVFNATDAEGLSNIPAERIFKLRNNTSGTITTLQLLPDVWTLSMPVRKGQEVICLKSNQTYALKRKIFVFSEDMASLADISDEATARKNADSALSEKITAAKNAINTLNGDDTVTGSVAKKIKDALAANGATAAEIREAWNPTPTTPTVTLEGVYDDVNSALIVTSTELAKLAAIDEGETFDIVIHATGVEYSGAAKYVSYIGANSDGAPPGYFLTNNGVPLWDSEYNYNTFHGCVMVSHYDRIDTGEIREGSW